ncbi:MAG: VOC family protein [Bacteroidales bacterium]|nr:VOC family protein [Bacteroidales bacterium]MBN2755655.1 VOC family protein [Bacteroidales bacterium]
MQKIISGIQQIGVGIPNVHEAWDWYLKNFNMDIPAFDAEGWAELMLPYTGNKPQERHAILALNMKGGGGFEIWQYKSRTPEKANFEIKLGDLGIFAVKIKTADIEKTYNKFKEDNLQIIGEIKKDANNKKFFFVKDLYGNVFQMVENNMWFSTNEALTGGVEGAIIGVTDIEKSIRFYSEILDYNEVLYDTNGKFDDLTALSGGTDTFRRALITHKEPRKGAFNKLFGNSTIELVQVTSRKAEKIFKDRFWGDLGFIHLCFDIGGMDIFREQCKTFGHPFTVDSRRPNGTEAEVFDMGEASGDFAYIEDPDGTLIELVEAHRIPLVKKIGWELNLNKRDRAKALPNWMVKMLSLKRVKEVKISK